MKWLSKTRPELCDSRYDPVESFSEHEFFDFLTNMNILETLSI